MRILLLIFVLLSFSIKAQLNPTDACGTGVQTLTVNASCTANNYTLNGSYANGGQVIPTCTNLGAGNDRDDGWYKFVATSAGTTIQLTGDENHVLAVYTGSCGTGELGCDQAGAGNTATVTVATTIGTTYYIQVYRRTGTNTATMTGTICLFTATISAGDNCSNAISLTPGASCSPTAGNTGSGYTSSGTGCTTGTPDDDIWYSFVATATSQVVTVDGASDMDAVLAVYTSCAATTSPTGGACVDNTGSDGTETFTVSGLTIGTTYYVKVHDYSTGGGNFTICVTNPPSAPSNDNCTAATALTVNADLNCGVTTAGTVYGATTSSQTNGCGGTADDDVWYSFVATSTTHSVSITNVAGSTTDMYHSVYGGTCGSPGTALICNDANDSYLTGLTIGATYFVRVYTWTSTSGQNSTFNVCIGTPPPPPSNDNCSGATSLTSAASCVTTAGDLTWATASGTPAGACFGTPDHDVWYSFVAAAGTHTITVNPNFDAYIQLYSGTCGSLTSLQCSDPNSMTATGLTVGTTYYIRVYYYYGGPSNGTFTICVTHCPSAPANDNCSGATALTVNAGSGCSSTTAGTLNCSTSSGVAVGACFGNPDDDVWYSFVATGSTHDFTLTTASGFDAYMQLFSGTCGSLTSIQCSDANTFSNSALTAGTTYYLRVYSYDAGVPSNGSFTLCINNPCPSGAPANDLPCAAVDVPIGTIASGDNSCSGSAGEPATPSCWTTGNRNTVWFSFVAPAGGSVKIKTAPGTLTNTQIAVYQGTCGAGMTMVTSACNDNAADCGLTDQYISELALSGLTVGATYHIAVDGSGDLMGTFAITVVSGSAAYPTSSGQECSTTIPVCASSLSVGNPGYQGIGFTCDDTGSASDNCTDGERGSVWYTITIQNAGSLSFNIVPNDYTGVYGSETDYDFILWKLAGAGSTTCAAIASNGGAGPVACNFSADGVTGLSSTGNAPAPYSTSYNGAYETSITVAAGDVFALVVENYSNSTSGFTIDFTPTSSGIINYTPPTSVTWSGGNNSTTWTTSANWGGCTPPTCTIDGVVSPASTFQPYVTSAMGTVVVKNLTIDPGATLTLGPNSVIQICQNLTNNGTIVADPTSTILFSDNTTTHALNGTLSGTSSLGNLTITDAAGSTNCTVIANTDIQLKGNFTTSNATSIFNLNSNILTLAGNFTNASAGTTFTGVTNSTLIFNGAAAQTYSPGGALTLNNVTMNHTGTGVSITATGTPNMIIGTAGVLTLTSGKIITPGTQQVQVTNTANASVPAGNATSFIQGNLLRYLAAGATGSFEFPVGHSTKGYQRANLNFTTAASGSASQLLARFDAWGGTFTQPGAPGWGPECLATYNQPFLDNGYWSIDVASGTSTGTYNITLYNTTYTNAAAGYSVGKSPSASPSWALQGTCVAMCPVTAVQRNGMSGFSKFATIQSTSVLPVQLLNFSGSSKGSYNELKWETIDEEGLDHFELQSSEGGEDFITIYRKEGTIASAHYASYRYNDFNYYSPVTYYRLKSVDKNGISRFSSIISVENKQRMLHVLSVFPNPASSEVNISIEAPFESNMDVQITDVVGRQVFSGNYSVKEGNQTIQLNTLGLSEGTYIVSCKFENLPVVNTRLVISK